MPYITQRSRKSTLRLTPSRTTLIAFAALAASLGSALVVPPPAVQYAAPSFGELADAQLVSSVRKTLNWGPNLQTRVEHDHDADPSSPLTVFNADHFDAIHHIGDSCDHVDVAKHTDLGRCVGRELARAFVKQLHPHGEYRLVSATVSQHSALVHAHFVQLIDGIPVSNGNLNVNVDLHTAKVLSYGDSSFIQHGRRRKSRDLRHGADGEHSAAPLRRVGANWKNRVQRWTSEAVQAVESAAGQLVFGSSAPLDSGPQGADAPAQEAYAAPHGRFDIADPREGLLTFLAIQATNIQLLQRIESVPRRDLIDQMRVVPVARVAAATAEVGSPYADSHDFVIENVPERVDEPVKATLSYVHDGYEIKLAWKYELKTHDNMYEAYMTADGDITPGNEEALLVCDWQRDLKPTGGELGIEAMASFGGPRSLLRDLDARDELASANAMPASPASSHRASTTDAKTVAKMQSVEPTYKVYSWGTNAPDEGKRLALHGAPGLKLDTEASPAGWHTVPKDKHRGDGPFNQDTFYYETRGNNVLAQDNPSGGNSMEGFRANGGDDMDFEFPIHMTKPGTPLDPVSYINASVTELFYTNNLYHDLLHRYGFDEENGNFQEYNFDRGGRGGDAVQANAQDGSGYNNANFATPPDGSRPRMRMYVWTAQQPYRDGDFEAGIVLHEYSHGLSTRLTGGPANSGCLGWGEAGGMGEAGGDFLATMVRLHDVNVTDYSMGEWASGRKNGIRYFRYSRNMTENPSTYKYLDKPGYWGVHAIGEVWAEMLFEMAENLIDVHGFHPTLFPPPLNSTDSDEFYSAEILQKTGKRVPAHGNTLAVQLVIDGFKLQPCRPTFVNARDAIITADKALTGGDNECIIWKSFAKRGLGPDARVVGSTPWGGGVHEEDYSVPKKCSSGKHHDKDGGDDGERRKPGKPGRGERRFGDRKAQPGRKGRAAAF
ncbi:hypothetical protein JCM10908_000683 [Rhodotorula pacifica]|uniref:M36 family metallopeptidase n=1 Tax=Rhodotorula pacifica TaxID=1495444 RepID=UPI0031799F4C